MSRIWMMIAGINGLIAVALSAYGFHSMKPDMTPDEFTNFQLASMLHLVHTLALLAVALMSLWSFRLASIAGALFLAGILLFSGSIYVLSFVDMPGINMAPPFGGLSFMLGWAVIAGSGLLGTKAD